MSKFFYFKHSNYYTHYDLQGAKKLGLKIELIDNGEPNTILYKTRASGKLYFHNIVQQLYDIKQKMKSDNSDCKLANQILQRLWGALCSKNKQYVKSGEKFDISDSKYAYTSLKVITPDNVVGVYAEKGKLFKYSYARLGTFLTSITRMKMIDYILPINAHVYRAFTDSIILDANHVINPTHLKIGGNIGDFKVVQSGQCIIKGKNKPEFI